MLSRTHRFVMIAALALLAGCSGQFRSDYDIAHERVAAYVKQHPGLDAETKDAMLRFELRNGMTMEEVIATWGRPAVVQRFREGQQQYWFFGCDWPHYCNVADQMFPTPDEVYQSRALFESGRVVAWQH